MPITGRLTTISTAAMLLLTMSVGSRAAVSLVEPNTALVSIAGTEIGGAASPAISGDGRFVIFIDDQQRLDEGTTASRTCSFVTCAPTQPQG